MKNNQMNKLVKYIIESKFNFNIDNLKGGIFISKLNNNHIFIPSGGCKTHNNLVDLLEGCGYIWTSSLHIDFPRSARFLYFDHRGPKLETNPRYVGQNIRPIIDNISHK